MSDTWPDRRGDMIGLRIRLITPLCNHDGPVKPGAAGVISATRSLGSFEVHLDQCGCCGLRRKVTYVERSHVELLT